MLDNAEKNFDQSSKSLNGNRFNKLISEMFMNLELPNVYFIGAEPKFYKDSGDDNYYSISTFRPDHWCIVVDEKRKTILSIITDGTTTNRDRTNGKAFNGIRIEVFKDSIKKSLEQFFPEYKDFLIINCNCIIFPNELSANLKNYEREQLSIDRICSDVNYGKSSIHSISGLHMLDCSLRINDLKLILEKISKDIENDNVILSQDTIRNYWIKYCSDSYSRKPIMKLTRANYLKDKNNLVYCLKTFPRKYSKEDLNSFIDRVGIHNTSKTNKGMIESIINYILKNN